MPDLIRLLDDQESLVQRAAHAALKRLTNQDYGPAADASQAAKAQAVTRWKIGGPGTNSFSFIAGERNPVAGQFFAGEYHPRAPAGWLRG